MAQSDSESDWSTSDGEVIGPRVDAGTECRATYKGVEYVGTSAAVSNDVPLDIVPFTTADGVAVWCRDPGNGELVALSRGECRKLVADIIGKGVKAVLSCDADIAACGVSFGTPFPIQMKLSASAAVPGDSTASGDAAGDAAAKVTFRYNKQHLTGTKVSFTPRSPVDGAVAVMVSADAGDGVYWVLPTSGVVGKWTAMTVTESKRAVKAVLGRALGSDGPSAADDDACRAACGTVCPVQLHDARLRNERAKQKRASVPAASSDSAAAESAPSKRKAVSLDEPDGGVDTVAVPAAKKRTVRATAVPTSVPTSVPAAPLLGASTQISVTLSGDAATLLPALEAVFGPR